MEIKGSSECGSPKILQNPQTGKTEKNSENDERQNMLKTPISDPVKTGRSVMQILSIRVG
jgi:hypothetical protein